MYYPRELENKINKYLDKPEIIAVKGPRQAGKTTLLKKIYNCLVKKKKCLFLSFEDREKLAVFEEDIKSFKQLYIDKNEVVFLDEFQYAEKGGQKLKYLFDTTNTKFIISGSSSLELVGKTGKYLVGRMFSFELLPFSFQEFINVVNPKLKKLLQQNTKQVKKLLSFETTKLADKESLQSESIKKKLNKTLETYILWGGYPRVILAEDKEERKEVLKNILDTYLLRDIKDLLNLATDRQLVGLAKFLSLQIGNPVVYKELSNSANLNYKQVKNHLQILEETYITNKIRPFFRNKRTELVKNPKLFFLDTGLRNQLINDFSNLKLRSDKGSLMENYVCCQLKKLGFPLKFWRTKSQAEVDFIIEKGNSLLPIEVKSNLINFKVGKSLYSFIKKYSPKTALVINQNLWGKKKINNTLLYYLPGYYL